MDDLLLIQCSVCANENQTFLSLDTDAVELFQKLLDPLHQHPFKIRLVHALQSNFPASHNKNMFFFRIHTSIFSLIFYSASFALRIPAIPAKHALRIPAKSALRFFLQSTLRGYRKLPSLRKRFTAAVTLSTTISISSISLNRPKLNRSAPSISLSFNPMAPSTWL